VIAGRYTLGDEIGRGGMGAVWRGRDEVLGRTVALKKIGVAPGGITPDALRAEREAKLAAKLNHANVVAVFDLVEDTGKTGDGPGQQWLVMEYVEGTNLSDLIGRRGRLTPDEAAPILAQTASALAAAHGAGIVHRDVKPSNILVTPQGQVKLSDFGIARTSSDPALTQTGLVTGSPAYLSPEVASGQQATPASDVWSWGATLYHALEGQPPYLVGDNLLGALYRIVHEEPPTSGSAGWLAPALASTMARDPRRRWHMAEVQQLLEAGPGVRPIVATRGGLADIGLAGTRPPDGGGTTQVLPLGRTTSRTAPPPAPDAPRAWARRRTWFVAAAATTALVIASIIAFAIGMGGGDGPAEDHGSAATPSTSPSTQPTSPSPSQSIEPPTEAAMTSFVRSYVDTAVRDPAAAWALLTPSFQQASNGFASYDAFWGSVSSARIQEITADPGALRVRYRYRYVKPGGPVTQVVTLHLVRQGDGFLIDGEG
jgi:serine/threonine protein kinase